ncbi:hypothetical protein PoB_000248900 [Plakobranchus ocellatus]|uniref:Secreted protein n=1 Tax=Plakobranchus ocellatus TaxID=259542 RepID=A0AAV3Y1X2_9GAST|nr:hypothetical protein PoB_000248900 [Plakobranchus ocellatus]
MFGWSVLQLLRLSMACFDRMCQERPDFHSQTAKNRQLDPCTPIWGGPQDPHGTPPFSEREGTRRMEKEEEEEREDEEKEVGKKRRRRERRLKGGEGGGKGG